MNEIQKLDKPSHSTKRMLLKSVQKRKLILRAALECFSDSGLSKTTLSDIAQKAQMGSSHILYHFKNTDEIFYELIQEMFKEAQNRAKDYTRKTNGTKNKLEAYVHAMFDWLFSNKDHQKLFLQFQSECLYQPSLKNLRNHIHNSGVEFFYYLIKDNKKAILAQNLLTGSLMDFCLNHIQNVKIREVTVEYIKNI